MNKRILILAYYFYPCNVIGANRPNFWADYYTKLGYKVTVVTRHWSGSEKDWDSVTSSSQSKKVEFKEKNGYGIYFLPYKKYQYSTNPLISKFKTFLNLFTGNIQPEVNAMGFWTFLKEHLKKERYDFTIASAEPYNIIRLASLIEEKFNIPFVADYRDFENHFVLAKDPSKNSFFKRIEFFFIKYYTKKWTKNALFISSVTDVMADFLGNLTGKKSVLITNGYEEMLFSKLKSTENKDVFQFTLMGTIYPDQSLEELFGGFKIFFAKYPDPKIQLNFIGLKANLDVAERVENNLPSKYLNVTERIPRAQAIQISKNSHILFYTSFQQWKGFFSGKIFEYLGLNRNILISPGDKSNVDYIVKSTNAGRVAPTAEKCGEYLIEWYEEWLKNGELTYKGIKEEILKYSRENQSEILLDELNKSLNINQKKEIALNLT